MKLSIYAHFGPTGSVVAHAWLMLQGLRDQGFETIFVSNSPIGSEDRSKLEAMTQRQIYRENAGLDFGMWQAALAATDLTDVEELVLTNSSVIGPLFPLANAFKTAATWECDFWGMTDSPDFDPHLQSYFLVFRKQALRSPAFRQFWDTVLPYQVKWQIIRSYEIGLTLWLEQHGLKWKALVEWNTVFKIYVKARRERSLFRKILDKRKRCHIDCNSPVYFPDVVTDLGVPFVKTSLFTQLNDRVTSKMMEQLIEKYPALACR